MNGYIVYIRLSKPRPAFASRGLLDFIWNGKQLCHEVLDIPG